MSQGPGCYPHSMGSAPRSAAYELLKTFKRKYTKGVRLRSAPNRVEQ